SEILYNPPGPDAPNEYIELRVAPNTTIPPATYLISIEGNTNGNPGTIQNVFDLSGRVIGGNGFLVLLQNSNRYAVHPHAALASNTIGPGWGHGNDGTVGHEGTDGTHTDLENASITFYLIQSSLKPEPDTDLDTDDNGSLEDPIVATWNVLDAVGVLDNDGLGDIAYGLINFRRNAAAIASGTIVAVGFNADYIARSGNTTGWSAADWVAGGGIGGAAPNWTLGASANTTPPTLAGAPLSHIGAPNFGAPTIPGIVITQSDNATTVGEDGSTDSYTIALNATPNGAVTLLITPLDGEVLVSTDNGASYGDSRSITLNSTAPRTIMVRAIDDNAIESRHTDRIVHSVSSSTSPVFPPGTLAPTVNPIVLDNEFILLSELKVNPPGTNDAPAEFIEVRGTPGAIIENIYVLVLEGDAGADPGTATMVVDLSGVALGASGLLLIAAPGHPYDVPDSSSALLDSQLSTPGGALGNGTISFFLLSSPAGISEGDDLDGGDNGVLEDLPVGSVLIDAVAWSDGDTNDVTYGGVVLTQTEGTPDAATRFSGDLTPLSVPAWFCGDLTGGAAETLVYHSRNVSTNFPAGTVLSPGVFNNTAPSVTGLTAICGTIGDPTNPTLTFFISDAESGIAGLTVSLTSSNQLVVPDANLIVTSGPGGQRTLSINPIGVGYSTLYVRVSDGITTNTVEVPYAGSEMGRPGGVFHIGTADASGSIPINDSLMWVADDENQI
ncbi:MAG: hypothetical protein L0219_20850, partial [Phycisphaerales bacterium]|nr:hypothetical protein [Phycisphaerales bacterium]